MNFTGDPAVDYFDFTDVLAAAVRPLLPARFAEAGIDRGIAMRVAIRLAKRHEVVGDAPATIAQWRALLEDQPFFEMEAWSVFQKLEV